MWLDSKGWAKRAAEGSFVPEDVQVLLREIGAKDALLSDAERALEPFDEIARRLEWDKILDDSPELDEHVIEAPAPDIAPGAVYCLMIRSFRLARTVLTKLKASAP